MFSAIRAALPSLNFAGRYLLITAKEGDLYIRVSESERLFVELGVTRRPKFFDTPTDLLKYLAPLTIERVVQEPEGFILFS